MRRTVLLLALIGAGCGPASPPSVPSKPSSVVAKEGELLTLTLTPEAEQRLGIKIAPVETKRIERNRTLGGELRIPPGRAATIAAPIGGTLSGTPPEAGSRVKKGQAILTLAPFLSAESRASFAAARIDAEGALEGAKVQLAAAKVALARAEQLLQDKAGSQRAVDDARAQRDAAQASVSASETRRSLLAKAVSGTLEAIPLEAPFDGILRTLNAAPGSSVTAGTALFEVVDLSRFWIRVPIYVGDLAGIDAAKEIRIDGRPAKPVGAPPSADPLTATVDLFYEVEGGDTLRPGQRISAEIPLRSAEDSLVAPWSAILHDINGGTWVYEKVADGKYVRRRVQVGAIVGPIAIVTGAIKVGTPVVIEGVPELFGAEFGHAR